MRQVDALRVSGLRIVVQSEGLAGLQRLLAVGELADAKLGTLQIGEDADRTADRLFHRADARDQRAHQLVVGVAHIDAEHVGTRLEQFLQHGLVGRGRTDRCEYLDLAAASHGLVCPVTAASPSAAGSSVS